LVGDQLVVDQTCAVGPDDRDAGAAGHNACRAAILAGRVTL
jgi:hypothetical protein